MYAQRIRIKQEVKFSYPCSVKQVNNKVWLQDEYHPALLISVYKIMAPKTGHWILKLRTF